ncbi:MAG: DNA recombination-mediator protein A, partial [Cyanobacteria bacterium J06607_10]
MSQSVENPLDSVKVDDFLQELATIQQSGSKRIA